MNDVQDVVFRSIQKLGHVFVLPVRSGSPLRGLILRNQGKELPSGLCLVIDGQPQELFQWQCARGFAGVSEDVLKKLVQEKKAKPVHPTINADPCDVLVTSLLLQDDPKATTAKVQSALAQRRLFEYSDGNDVDPDFDFEILDDLCGAEDRSDFTEKKRECTVPSLPMR